MELAECRDEGPHGWVRSVQSVVPSFRSVVGPRVGDILEPPHLCLVEVEHASSDGGGGEDKGCCTALRLLKVTDGGHRIEERASAVKELQDRGLGSYTACPPEGRRGWEGWRTQFWL